MKLIRFDNIDQTDNFLPAFLQREEKYSLKLKLNRCLLQLLLTFVLNSPKFLLHQFMPKYFHVHILKLIDDICLDLVHGVAFKPFNN